METIQTVFETACTLLAIGIGISVIYMVIDTHEKLNHINQMLEEMTNDNDESN